MSKIGLMLVEEMQDPREVGQNFHPYSTCNLLNKYTKIKLVRYYEKKTEK